MSFDEVWKKRKKIKFSEKEKNDEEGNKTKNERKPVEEESFNGFYTKIEFG